MKATVVTRDGSALRFALQDVSPPAPGANELLIGVKAAGLNRADLIPSYPSRSTRKDGAVIAGRELAGVVLAFGAHAMGFAIGDRVMAMAEGAFAEQALVDHRLALRIPGGIDWAEAASIPVAFATAHDAMITNGGLAKGETVLVNAASSGVGVAALQIARLKGAGLVVGTTGSASKLERLAGLGADLVIDTGKENFADAILAKTDNRGADVIIDNVGKGVLADNIRVAAIKGRIVSVGRLGGNMDSLDLDELARKRLKLIGVTFRTRTLDERIAVARRFAEECLPAFSAGRLRALVHQTFPLADAPKALSAMKANAHVGKLVITA
ncbi:MAG TPA: zinc-binding dehydrogenase [Candidatus Cybelea sp.]|nr:zinc-binding dehydrogenase [Candidatus Cybelea sp.]